MSGRTENVKATEARPSELPVFVTEETRTKLMAIYDEALRHWPVPFVDPATSDAPPPNASHRPGAPFTRHQTACRFRR